MLTELYEKITNKKKSWGRAIEADVHDLAVEIGRAELGLASKKLDEDHAAGILEASGLTEADLRATIDTFKNRVRRGPTAAELETHVAAAAALEREIIEHEQETARIARERHEKKQALDEAFRKKLLEADKSREDDYYMRDTSETSAREKELIAEHQELDKKVRKLRVMLDPNARQPISGLAYMVGTHPAGLARVTRAELADMKNKSKRVNNSPERRAMLENRLEIAEKAVAVHAKELATLQASLDAITAGLNRFTADKYKAENFRIVRVKPSRDEQSKQLAREKGYVADRN